VNTVVLVVDHSAKTVNFGVEIYNAGNIVSTTPFRVDISVTRTTFGGQFIVNSVTMNPVTIPIYPNAYYKIYGNIDPLFYVEDNVKYEIEGLVDHDYLVPDVNRSNNSIKVSWWTAKPDTLKKLPARFENKK
jgi:hypothetical protein